MKFKIWKADADESSAVKIEAASTYDAAIAHAESTWQPSDGEEVNLLARDADGVLMVVDVFVEFEPTFDVWIRRADEPDSSGPGVPGRLAAEVERKRATPGAEPPP